MAVQENIIDFNKICRLCLTEESVMSSIYGDQDRHSSAVSLPLRIMACVSIELNSVDGLPSQICTTCLCQVDGWYKFKDLCETADAVLKKCIRNEPVQLETISQIRNKAQEIRQFFASPNFVKVEGLESALKQHELTKKSMRKVGNGKGDEFKLYSLLRLEGQSVPEAFESVKEERLEMGISDVENFEGERESKDDAAYENEDLEDSLDRTLANQMKSTSDSDGPDDDDFSSDDDLTLSAKRKKMLQEKNKSNKLRTKKKVTMEKKSGIVRYSRTVQTQTVTGEEDTLEFIEAIVVDVSESHVDETVVDKKKFKSRKTQTLREQCGGKKRFRIRPAVPSSCTLCDKVYKNGEILRQHMKSHHVTGTIECPSCKLTFTSLRSLKYHEQRKHSNLEPVPCTFCGKKFLDKKYLRIHENIHSQANHFVCQFCGRKFIMKTNLTVHISRHHTKKSNDFICQICGKAFPFKLYLKKHFKTHTDYKPYQCTYCDAKFRENTLLRKHVNSIHLKLRPFLCQYCHKTFTRSLYLREHMESQHLGIQRKVECSRCGETFQNRNRLRQHECLGRMEIPKVKVARKKKKLREKEGEKNEKTISKSGSSENWTLEDQFFLENDFKTEDKTEETNNVFLEEMGKTKKRKLNYSDITYDHPVPTKDGKIHQCRICRKYLKNVTTRNRHEIEKHPPPLPCEFCQKTFTTVLTYHTHRNIHLGLTKYKCKHCGKHLASRSNLEDHEKVHTKERPIECPQCDKTFSSVSNLRVHLKFHAGVKTHFCHICGKGHVTVGNLKLHVKRHSNERSHVCHICGKGFNGKSELKKHIESHNTEKKYSCQYCLQKLKTPNSLRRHVNIQHLKLKPYRCDFCLRDFGRRENLKEHMQVHTSKKEFFCESCNRQFTNFGHLNSHKCI